MKTHEPECVVLKRQGAEYVAHLLAGKSRQEVIEFWRKRTDRLRSLHNMSINLSRRQQRIL